MASNKDFVTMKTDVADFLGDPTNSFATKIGKWLNYRYRDIMGRYQWSESYDTFTMTLSANQQAYALPNDYDDIVYVFDNTNKMELLFKPETAFMSDPTLISSSAYYTISESTVGTQPTSSSVIKFTSDNAADNTQTMFIKGTSNGFQKTETVVLAGTTGASTINSYTKIIQISKSAVTAGGVTVTSNAGAVTNTYLNPTQLQTRDRMIRFYWTPAATVSIIVRYKRDILPLINDYDYPLIDCSDEMSLGAQADAWRAKRQFSKAASLETQYESMVNLLMFQEEQNKDISIDPIPYSRSFNGVNMINSYSIV